MFFKEPKTKYKGESDNVYGTHYNCCQAVSRNIFRKV